MKKILAVISSALILAGALSGCGGKKYQLYTNMPQGGFKADNNYSVNLIEGGAFGDIKPEKAENAESFQSKRKEWFGIINTDLTASLVLSDNFQNEEVQSRYNSLCEDIDGVLEDINYSLSATLENSSIYKFNAAKAGATVEITQTAYTVLKLTQQIYGFTEGYYNPAVYYSVQAYGFGGAESYPQKAEDLPKDGDIEKYNTLSSAFADLQIYEEDGKYYAVKPETTVEVNGETLSLKLDLGGIGKGYAVDIISGLMDGYGFKYGYFNFGGSSIFYKSHYSEGNYDLAITDPRNIIGGYYMVAPIANQGVSTSGDNAQFYIIDGVRYCHIINPKTGKPVQTGIASATIMGGSAAEDDAYTTAIMAMGKEKAVEFIQTKLTDRRVVFTLDKK